MKAIVLMGLITVSCLCARDRIAYIGFYGYQGLDLEAIRKALPFHKGDAYSLATLEQIRSMVLKLTGKPATEVAPVCCLNDGDRAIFIGLSGESTRELKVNPAPAADLKLSAEVHLLYRRMSEAEQAASRKGENGEEGTGGFRLSKDPEARAAELKVRDYALQHEPELVRVLGMSRYPDERSKAADVLGYGGRSQTQIAALVHAALDPVSDVRNESTRALGEILEADPSVRAQMDAGPYLALVKSGIWTDRNKGAGCWRA
jgi:hypothetical protein